MPSFIFLLVAIIAFARFAAAAEELWEASPRSFALTKGKAAAANSGVSSALSSSSLVTAVQYNAASTSDGTIFLTNGADTIYSYQAPYTTAPATCGAAASFDIGSAPNAAAGGSITNNGNTLYFAKGDYTVIYSSAVTSTGAKGAPKTYSCGAAATATTLDAATTLATLVGTAGVAIHYAPGLLSAAKAPKATKGSTTDAFVLVGGASATAMGISIVSTVTSSAALAVDTVGYSGTAGYAALSSAPCTDVQLNYIGGVAISGKDLYVSSYVYAAVTYALIYKITTAMGVCTGVTEFAGSPSAAAGGTAPTALVAGVKGTGVFVTAAAQQSMSLVFSGSTLYVSEVGGIAAVNADTGSIIGYVVGQDASAARGEGVGSYSNWKQPGALVIPAGKSGGNLIATDLDTDTFFRKVTWAGAAKVKVGAPKAPKA